MLLSASIAQKTPLKKAAKERPMTAPSSAGALAGIKVIDLSRVLGGPFATQLLSDHGADVIKLEPPQGDEVRDWGPPFNENEDASYFIGVNRNKRSVVLDLAQPEGRAVLLRLLEGADVLIENFKPGSMEKWGIGYDELAKKFPRLIYCKVSGFGAEGPLGGFPGYDAIVGAMAGHYSVNGSAETGPMRMGIAVVDITTGLYSVIGIMLAMHERQTSGKGQFIDCALYDSALSLMHPHFPNYFLSGKVPGLTGNTHGNLAPYGMFPTKTCRVMIGAGNNRAFKRVCEELGVPEMAEDPRFATNGDRVKHRDDLNRIITVLVEVAQGGLALRTRAQRRGSAEPPARRRPRCHRPVRLVQGHRHAGETLAHTGQPQVTAAALLAAHPRGARRTRLRRCGHRAADGGGSAGREAAGIAPST
jgi:crotonobetainyl-CoA:carnitine CoA-transferase CaiB-like acyl-CoA transferase